MKKLILLTIAITGSIHNQVLAAESACTRACSESEIENVQVLFVPPDVDTRAWRAMARSWYEKATGMDDPATIRQAVSNGRNLGLKVVRDANHLRERILELANDCKRIKFLGVFSHGNLGYVSLGDYGLSPYTVDAALGGLDCAMAEGATVHFGGCNVGRGCRGEQFMALVADNLLKKGGKVRANTNYATTPIPVVIPHTSINGDTQILKVKSGPEVESWDNSPQTLKACRGRIKDAYDRLDNLKVQMATCLSYNPYGIPQSTLNQIPEANRRIDEVKEELMWADAQERFLEKEGEKHSGFTRHHRAAAKQFYKAFLNYHSVVETYGDIGPCIGCNSGGCHSDSGHRKKIDWDVKAPAGIHGAKAAF